MGMTKVFYIVKKNQLISKKIREKLSEVSALDDLYYTVFYKETKDWFQVFDEYCCEGRYNADEAFMVSLEKTFGSTVIALSTFDSDAAFFSICENGELHRYVWADKRMLEEDYLAEALQGRIQYFATSYSDSPDHNGRAAIRLDGKAILSGNYWNQWYKAHLPFMDDVAMELESFGAVFY